HGLGRRDAEAVVAQGLRREGNDGRAVVDDQGVQASAPFGHVAFGGVDDVVDLFARERLAQDVVDIGAPGRLQRLVYGFVAAAGRHHGDGRIGHEVANALQVVEAVFAAEMDVDEN